MEPRILRPDRLRHVPAHFSWVDHRLVRNKHMQYCEPKAWAMYLFLVTVGNAHGVSWYSNSSMAKLMNVPECILVEARRQLESSGLIAFDAPFYQVLELRDWQPADQTLPRTSSIGPESIGELLRRLGGAA